MYMYAYTVHVHSALEVEHCQTLQCSKYIYRSKAMSCIVEGGQNGQPEMPMCAFGSTVKTGS